MTATATPRIVVVGPDAAAGSLVPEAVGGKAANLARLDALGLTVPPALALPTSVCRAYMSRNALPDGFRAGLRSALRHLERATGCGLGGRRPLLVSVRSSPPVSMPGMLETVLNVGMSEEAVHGLLRRAGNPWHAWDVYRRFVRSYAETVCGAPAAAFDRITAEHLSRAAVHTVQDLDPVALRDLARTLAGALPDGATVPADPVDQVLASVEAVLRSWMSPAAVEYRRLNGIDERTGTGVLIQAMVFGNNGARSGSGVGFTRNPATGARELYVDFLVNAQGEDVVAGRLPVGDAESLRVVFPEVWQQLATAAVALEREFGDMQDFEFTLDEGHLFFLQTRAAKRTPWAAVHVAADLVRERIIDEPTALARLEQYDLDDVVRVVLRPRRDDRPVARATPASLGVASGRIVFDAARAAVLGDEQPVIFVSTDLATEDIAGLAASAGVLTTFGGRTSHAAVVARQLGKVCLVGCSALHVDSPPTSCVIGSRRFHEGDAITLDGETGLVYPDVLPVAIERPDEELALIAKWKQTAGTADAIDRR